MWLLRDDSTQVLLEEPENEAISRDPNSGMQTKYNEKSSAEFEPAIKEENRQKTLTNADSLIDIGGRRHSKRYVKTKGGTKVPLHSIIEMNIADKQKISVLKRQENYNLVKSEESL